MSASPIKDHAKFVEAATVSAQTIEDIDTEHLESILLRNQFARITGLVSPEAMKKSRDLLSSQFSRDNDAATTGEAKEAVRDNFQKLSIGCARHGSVNRPRFMRTFYNPIWAEDIYELHDAFRTQCRVRNMLGGLDPEFAVEAEEEGMWTAARIHHFPAGGGFMVAHRDTVLPTMYKSKDLAFFQTLLLITQKGEDFTTGGGFVELEGERISFEDYANAGDIIIYNQKTVHGVDDIDVNVPFRQDSLAGRMSGLVTLYKAL